MEETHPAFQAAERGFREGSYCSRKRQADGRVSSWAILVQKENPCVLKPGLGLFSIVGLQR